MSTKILHLSELLSQGADSISGRSTGEKYLKDNKVLEALGENNKVRLIISEDIEAINDSFWKGFFRPIMMKYKNRELICDKIKIEGDSYFIESVSKNLIVLESIYS